MVCKGTEGKAGGRAGRQKGRETLLLETEMNNACQKPATHCPVLFRSPVLSLPSFPSTLFLFLLLPPFSCNFITKSLYIETCHTTETYIIITVYYILYYMVFLVYTYHIFIRCFSCHHMSLFFFFFSLTQDIIYDMPLFTCHITLYCLLLLSLHMPFSLFFLISYILLDTLPYHIVLFSIFSPITELSLLLLRA